MQNPDASRNLKARLSEQTPTRVHPTTAGTDYVQHVRAYVADCPNSGSQQHRLRYGDESWLVSQHRWLTEQRAAGTAFAPLRRVLQACLYEIDVMEQMESSSSNVSVDHLADAARTEGAAGYHEDMATNDALLYKTPGYFRRVADYCNSQIEALRQKGRVARTLAAKELAR